MNVIRWGKGARFRWEDSHDSVHESYGKSQERERNFIGKMYIIYKI